MSKEQNFNADLIAGLSPVIELPEVGKVFRDTTNRIAEKVAEELRSTAGISEVDKIFLIPRVAKNNVGASDMVAQVFFNTKGNVSGEPNIYYRGSGKGNNKGNNGRISMVNFGNGGNTSNYGMSDKFKAVFAPLCLQNDNGKPLFRFKQVQGVQGIVSLDLDFNAVICLALGVKSNDPYDFSVVSVSPIGGNNGDFSVVLMKMIAGNQKGKTSGVNYSRIQQERFNQVNSGGRGGNQGGGRSY